jgi:hypothetical protein
MLKSGRSKSIGGDQEKMVLGIGSTELRNREPICQFKSEKRLNRNCLNLDTSGQRRKGKNLSHALAIIAGAFYFLYRNWKSALTSVSNAVARASTVDIVVLTSPLSIRPS